MIFLQYLLPHYLINKLAKMLGNCSIYWIKTWLIKYFLRKYSVNLAEALNPDPNSYRNYNDFFTRKLHPQARKINFDSTNIVSPCDGYITQYGNIDTNMLITAKSAALALPNLLGTIANVESCINIKDFTNGKFINIYLAPHNYHRIHIPTDATLTQMIYIPGKLFSVNPKVLAQIPDVFSINERVICVFDSAIGKFILVLVGAMIVGSIVTSWHGEVNHNAKARKITVWDYRGKGLSFTKGQELGYFQLGSTVIGFFANHRLVFDGQIQANGVMQMGQVILQLK